MNSTRHTMLGPLFAIADDVRDCADVDHHMSRFTCSFTLATEYVAKIVRTRGNDILLITLPDLGKVYDKGLSSTLSWDSVHSLLNTTKLDNPIVKLFASTFDTGGRTVTPNPTIVAFTRQFLYMYKKLNMEAPRHALEKAVTEFLQIEESLRVPSGTWEKDTWIQNVETFRGSSELRDSHPRSDFLWHLVDRIFRYTTPLGTVESPLSDCRHGPGAVSDLGGRSDKYTFPHWPLKADNTFGFLDHGIHRQGLNMAEAISQPSQKEPPARLIAVPKTFKGPRLIASEPTAHQFLQQGLMRWIRDNLTPPLRNSISFKSQTPSRDAALLASRRGDTVTVDLSSASDRLSCWTVERAFSSNQSLLRALHAVRTRTIIDGTGTSDFSIRIKKFAAQGSAVTFPVQTIIYTTLAYAAVLWDEGLHTLDGPALRKAIMRISRKVRVFGDDIIIPKGALPILSVLLTACQLKINASKTHYSGGFRESCGMDAWRGHDVTPTYLTHLQATQDPTSIQSLFDCASNFHKAGYWKTSRYVASVIPYKVRKRSVISRNSGPGLRLFSYCDGFITAGQPSWCEDTHQELYNVIDIVSRPKREGRRSWQNLLQYFVEDPMPYDDWASGYLTRSTQHLAVVRVPLR